MFEPLLLAKYMVAVTLLTITPGVDTALVVQSTCGARPSDAYRVSLGILLGCATWGCLVALGLGVVVTSSDTLYQLLKTLGAGYLVWIGVSSLLKTRAEDAERPKTEDSAYSGLRRGLLVNLLNPKVGLFYLSIIPQFTPPGVSASLYSLVLVAIHIALSATWFWLLITSLSRAQRGLLNHHVMMWVERLTGALFIVFGLQLLIASR